MAVSILIEKMMQWTFGKWLVGWCVIVLGVCRIIHYVVGFLSFSGLTKQNLTGLSVQQQALLKTSQRTHPVCQFHSAHLLGLSSEGVCVWHTLGCSKGPLPSHFKGWTAAVWRLQWFGRKLSSIWHIQLDRLAVLQYGSDFRLRGPHIPEITSCISRF